MKICIVRLSALGDIVMMLPLVRTLQKSFPHVEITWCIGKTFYPLLKEMKGIHFIPINKFKSVTEFFQERQKIPKKTFDYLLATQASLSAHLLYPFIRAKRKIGYDKHRSKDFHRLFVRESIEPVQEHTLEGFLRFGKHIGAEEISLDSSIPLIRDDFKVIDQYVKNTPYYVINPCSSKPEKDWPLTRYVEVAESIYKTSGYTLVLTGGVEDQKASIMLKNTISGPVIDLTGKTNLRELAALLAKAKFLISPDTGPAHIASALKTPVIGLFAVTSPHMTGPYFSKETLIDKHQEAFEKFATKKQKKLGWKVPIDHQDAMQLINTEDVINTAHKLIIN